jgi:hypothetical protein
VLALAALASGPAALAANPSQIYRDYADNGRLDHKYSSADLGRALKNASIQGYGKPTTNIGFKGAVQGRIASQSVQPSLPFTGFDLALLTVGGASLLAVGSGLRRVSRSKK